MAGIKLLNLFALVSVALVVLCSGPGSVNALTVDRSHVARHVRGHDAAARRRRDTVSSNNKRCQPKPPTTPSPSSPTPPPPADSPASTPSPSTPAPAYTSSTPLPSSTPSSGGNSSGKKWGLAWPNGDSDYLTNFASLPNVG